MRPSGDEIMKQLLDTDYIDAHLKDINFNHINHTVELVNGEYKNDKGDFTVIFKDCFSAKLTLGSKA